MADAGARARTYARPQHNEADYGPEDHEEGFQTPEFDNALRLTHHAQRLKAMELGLEHFSSGINVWKSEQRRLFRRQTIITLSVGGFCLFSTIVTGIIASTSHRATAVNPAVVASAAPQSLPSPAPTYMPVPQAPAVQPQQPAPVPTINSAQNEYAAPTYQQAPAAPAYVEEPTLEMPKPADTQRPVAMGRYTQVPIQAVMPSTQPRKLTPFENNVSTRLAATGQLVPDSWQNFFTREAGGDARAKLQIAAKFLKGEGIKPDPSFAVTLIRQAAQAGNKEAMMWLAYSFEAGNLGKADPVSAAHWFSEAAKAGVTGAYAELGKLYEKGVDGAPDNEVALSWYQRAVKAGDANAAADITRLNRIISAQNNVAAEPAPQPQVQVPVAQRRPLAPMLQPAMATNDARQQQQMAAASVPAPPPQGMDGDSTPQAEVDRMADIRAAQRMLKVLGYKIDKADGALGPQTQTAIRSYQRDHAAYPDGLFTTELLESLTRDIRFGSN
jgi:hypothetical protein